MKRNQLIVLLAAVLPGLSFAQDSRNYQCSYGDLQRRVEIVSEAGLDVPCEVHYYKDSEAPDERQVLWNAQNEAGYCESRTQEFIAKLEGWGWACGGASAPVPVAEPEPVKDVEAVVAPDDDTDALVPAEEAETAEGS